MPTMGGDDARAADAESEAFGDQRMATVWDPESQVSQLIAKTLQLRSKPWDMYLLYASGARWEDDEPPNPTFWMHQIPEAGYGVDPKALLDPGRLLEAFRQHLGKADELRDPDKPLLLHAQGLDWVIRDREGAGMEEIAEALKGSREEDK
jgi:hypothetical protein